MMDPFVYALSPTTRMRRPGECLRQHLEEFRGQFRALSVGPLLCLASLLAATETKEHRQRPRLAERGHRDANDDPEMAPVEERPLARR
jgi:hypothetical protein